MHTAVHMVAPSAFDPKLEPAMDAVYCKLRRFLIGQTTPWRSWNQRRMEALRNSIRLALNQPAPPRPPLLVGATTAADQLAQWLFPRELTTFSFTNTYECWDHADLPHKTRTFSPDRFAIRGDMQRNSDVQTLINQTVFNCRYSS